MYNETNVQYTDIDITAGVDVINYEKGEVYAGRLKDSLGELLLEVYDYTELEKILSGSLKKESDFNSSSKRIAYLLKRLIESTSPLLIAQN